MLLNFARISLISLERMGMAHIMRAREFRAGDAKHHADVPCDLTAAGNRFIYVTSRCRYVCTYCPEDKKENRKDKVRKRTAESSRKSTEVFFVDLWFQKPSLMK